MERLPGEYGCENRFPYKAQEKSPPLCLRNAQNSFQSWPIPSSRLPSGRSVRFRLFPASCSLQSEGYLRPRWSRQAPAQCRFEAPCSPYPDCTFFFPDICPDWRRSPLSSLMRLPNLLQVLSSQEFPSPISGKYRRFFSPVPGLPLPLYNM